MSCCRGGFRRKIAVAVVICITCSFIYYDLNVRLTGSYMWKNYGRGCTTSKEDMKQMTDLVNITHNVLEELGLEHFLIYGSLLGALRYKSILPWDYDFDFGVVYEDLVKIKEKTFIRAFRSRNVDIMYRPYAGSYYLQKGKAHGDLLIFRDWYKDGIMHRIGFESYLFFIHYRKFHIFPAFLIKRPLPKIQFTGLNVSIARDPVELTKYFYPDNWKYEGAVVPSSINDEIISLNENIIGFVSVVTKWEKISNLLSKIPKIYPKVFFDKIIPRENPISLKNSQDLGIKSQV